jgi:hypothetical protein
MSVLIFGIILPGIALGTAPRVSYPNNMNLRVARISVLFISAGAFMIGLSGSLRAITIGLSYPKPKITLSETSSKPL